MAPKAKSAPVRSQRFTAILEDIKDQKKKAQQLLSELRSKKRNEERRHRRIICKASMLGASELMDLQKSLFFQKRFFRMLMSLWPYTIHDTVASLRKQLWVCFPSLCM